MKAHLPRAAAALGIAAAAVTVAIPAFASASTARPAATRTTLADTIPSWAVAAHVAGVPAASTVRTFEVNLPLRNEPAAEAFVASVSNPKSAAYGDYLTPAEFNARFSPTASQAAAVESWLKASGFAVVSVPSNNRYIETSGTVAQIDRAFSTTVKTYSVAGLGLESNSTALSVPSSIAGDVLAVTGLNDGFELTRPDHIVADPTGEKAHGSITAPCSKYWGQHSATFPAAYGVTKFATYICGYKATQLEGAYGVAGSIASGRDGAGVTVAITDAYASSTIVGDVDAFSKAEGVSQLGKTQLTQNLAKTFDDQGACGGSSGWNLEESLDVEAVHTMAPGASILYMGAANCEDALGIGVVNDIVANKLANVVTDSWSDGTEDLPASSLAAEHAIWVQGAAEGIGFNFSAGDNGDLTTATGQTQPSVPASDPEVTAVGGTTLAVTSIDGYGFETAWGNVFTPVAYSSKGAPVGYSLPLPGEFYAGGGGGTSHVFPEPSYQKGVVPTSLSDEYGSPARVVPDVSALADPFTGLLMFETIGGTLQSFAIGGTSLASPLFAGIEALADQGRAKPIGFANPLLYSQARTGAFHDVVPTVTPTALAFTPGGSQGGCAGGCLVTEGMDTSLQTTYGYDNATGLGTPNGASFLSALDS